MARDRKRRAEADLEESPSAQQPRSGGAGPGPARGGGAGDSESPECVELALALLKRRVLRDVSDVVLTQEQEDNRRRAKCLVFFKVLFFRGCIYFSF